MLDILRLVHMVCISMCFLQQNHPTHHLPSVAQIQVVFSMSDVVAPPEEWWLVGGFEPATNRDLMGFNRDLYITIINGIS